MKNDTALDYLNYQKKRIFKGYALLLSSQNTEQIDTLNTFLSTVLTGKKIPLFTLKNKDTLLFFNNNKTPLMMDTMYQLKKQFPNLKQTRFDLKTQWEQAFQTIYDIQIFPTHTKKLTILEKLPKTPLDISVFDELTTQLTWDKIQPHLSVQHNCIVLNLTNLRQKLFPQIDLSANPVLSELLYRHLTHHLVPEKDLFYPHCVLDLPHATHDKIILRLSDTLRYFSVYQNYRKTHPTTQIKIEQDIPITHINLSEFQDTFMTFQ